MTKKKFVPVVAVLNMKGGVGKTTLSANLFRRLYRARHVSTLLLDMDPQFNLSQSLYKRKAYENLKSAGKTIAAVMKHCAKPGLKEISAKHQEVPIAKILSAQLKYIIDSDPLVELKVVPGDFDLVQYSLMDDHKQLKSASDRFKVFIDKAKDDFGLIVMDCNPSSSFLTKIAIENCTHLLVPVRLDKYSVLGLEMLWEFVHDKLPVSPKPQFIVIINGAKNSKPTKEMIETEAELRGHSVFGSRTLANTMRETALLKARSDYTGFNLDRKTSITKKITDEIDKISDELAKKLGL